MAENRRGRDRRYYYTFGQMLLLGAAFTLASIVIFFMGIFIGKGIEARKMVKPEEPLVKMPVKPSAQGSAGSVGAPPKEELTFYDTLTKSPPAPPTAEGRVKETKEPKKVFKREAKEGRADSKDEAAPATDRAPEKKTEKKTVPLAEKPKETGEAERTAKRETKTDKPEAREASLAAAGKVVEKMAEKASPLAEAAKATLAPDSSETKEAGKIWSVQVDAYPDERSAQQLVDRLKKKGYNPSISELHNKGKIWYRVRVGRYNTREEVDKALEVFKSKENFEKAFATSR